MKRINFILNMDSWWDFSLESRTRVLVWTLVVIHDHVSYLQISKRQCMLHVHVHSDTRQSFHPPPHTIDYSIHIHLYSFHTGVPYSVHVHVCIYNLEGFCGKSASVYWNLYLFPESPLSQSWLHAFLIEPVNVAYKGCYRGFPVPRAEPLWI